MRKTAWNLNRDKAEGLLLFITYALEQYPAEDKAEKLLHLLVERVRIRLRNSLDQVNAKNNYRITLSAEEAIAFWIWQGQLTPLAVELYQYETHIAQQLSNTIDQQYG